MKKLLYTVFVLFSTGVLAQSPSSNQNYIVESAVRDADHKIVGSLVDHQLALPIEEVSYEEDASGLKILGGNITEYSHHGAALPNKVYQLETDYPLLLSSFKFSNYGMGQLSNFTSGNSYLMDSRNQQRINYNKYSTGGNLLELQISLGPKSVYLWSYNLQYPIAEIKNADYATVESVLGGSASVNSFNSSNPTDAQVNALVAQLRLSLPEAAVTGYTYKPLVGMTSQTGC